MPPATQPQPFGISSLPDRLRATDFRSTSRTDLLHAFLTDASRNPHHKQKPFKSRDEFYEYIIPTLRTTAAAAQLDAHRQILDMLSLMSKIETQLCWAAADAYWWRVQAEMRQGTHVFLAPGGVALCSAVFTALFHEYSGRHRSTATDTKAAAGTPTKRKGAGAAGQCIHHPLSTTHTTATCRAAAAGTSTTTESKHA